MRSAHASNVVILGLLLATAGPLSLTAADISLLENNGFCEGGGVSQPPVKTWGSYCAQGDADIGHASTSTFRLSGPFEIYLAGDPTATAVSLSLENLSDHQSLAIRPTVAPGVLWKKSKFLIPDSWRGKDLCLQAEDHSTGPMGWLSFSGPLMPDGEPIQNDARKLLLQTLLFTALIFLPGLLFCTFAISRGVHGVVKLGLIALAGIATPGYLLFFVYVISAKTGYFISQTLPFVALSLFLFLLFRLSPQRRHSLRRLIVPFGITFLASVGVLSLGYLYGGTDTPNATAMQRFSHLLPPDNQIPYLFAEGVRVGAIPRPLQGDWLSSDRPPLQTGMILALEPWIKGRQLACHVASAILQSLWIFAVWLLMTGFRVGRITTALVIATLSLSGFAIVNTFYVWPKLLAAAYTLAFLLPVFITSAQPTRTNWWRRWLLSFLLTCGLLAHGGTVFAILGSVLLLFLPVRTQRWKETAIVLALTVLLYSPWLAYQKFIDPPGDRLMKYHLAGVEQATKETTIKTILTAYSRQTFDQWRQGRLANFTATFGHETEFLKNAATFLKPASAKEIRALEFFYLLPALGFTAIGVLGLPFVQRKNRMKAECKAAKRLLLWSLSTAIVWALMMFQPSSTVVHQGSYAMVLAAASGSILAFRVFAPKLVFAVCLMQCVFQWLVYFPDLRNVGLSPALAQATTHWMLVLHFASVLGFGLVLARFALNAKSQASPPHSRDLAVGAQ